MPAGEKAKSRLSGKVSWVQTAGLLIQLRQSGLFSICWPSSAGKKARTTIPNNNNNIALSRRRRWAKNEFRLLTNKRLQTMCKRPRAGPESSAGPMHSCRPRSRHRRSAQSKADKKTDSRVQSGPLRYAMRTSFERQRVDQQFIQYQVQIVVLQGKSSGEKARSGQSLSKTKNK